MRRSHHREDIILSESRFQSLRKKINECRRWTMTPQLRWEYNDAERVCRVLVAAAQTLDYGRAILQAGLYDGDSDPSEIKMSTISPS
jgi:hypothetical protein